MAVLEPGAELVNGRFRVESALGHGGFGEVYLGRQTSMDRPVAIKVLLPEVAKDPQLVQRFKTEAEAAGRLSHPHILPVHDFLLDDATGLWFLVMQYVPGGRTLRDLTGRLHEPAEVARIITAIGGALDAAHAAGIVHRDVNPANVLMMNSDWPLLADFGIARLESGSKSKMTVTGTVVGTPAYMSPEQAMGQPVTARSDQYSLAIIAYELLGGRPPFVGDSFSLIVQQANGTPPPLTLFNPDVPASVRAMVMQALSKDPDARFGSCLEFARALASAAHWAPPTAETGKASATSTLPPSAPSTSATSEAVPVLVDAPQDLLPEKEMTPSGQPVQARPPEAETAKPSAAADMRGGLETQAGMAAPVPDILPTILLAGADGGALETVQPRGDHHPPGGADLSLAPPVAGKPDGSEQEGVDLVLEVEDADQSADVWGTASTPIANEPLPLEISGLQEIQQEDARQQEPAAQPLDGPPVAPPRPDDRPARPAGALGRALSERGGPPPPPATESASVRAPRKRTGDRRWFFAIPVAALVLAGVVIAVTRLPDARSGESGLEVSVSAAGGDSSASQMPLASTVSLRVGASVEGANILVNGETAGRAPQTLSLPPGRHQITIQAATYRDWTQTLDVAEGSQPPPVQATLDPLPAIEVLEIADRVLGRHAGIDGSRIVRVGEPADRFQVSDVVNAVVYFRPKTFQIRDISYSVSHRWQIAGQAEPGVVTGTSRGARDQPLLFTHACALAAQLDPRGSGAALNLDVLVDEDVVASFTFAISGGNPADAPPNPAQACDPAALPTVVASPDRLVATGETQ